MEEFGEILLCCLTGFLVKVKVKVTADIDFALLGIPRTFYSVVVC